MAQAPLKSSKSATASVKSKANPTRGSNSSKVKKGGRTIAPKKKGLVSGKSVVRKHTAGLTALTEKTLGARVGHLELLGGGKKSTRIQGKGAKSVSKAKAGKSEVKKGGTRKFG